MALDVDNVGVGYFGEASMIWLALGLLAQAQDDLCPLREGMIFTYEVREKAGTARDQSSAVRAPHTIAGSEWFEVSQFLFYEKAYLRVSERGLEFRAPEYGDRSLLLFRTGAKLGEDWTSELTGEETMRFRLEAREDVEVPAGTYRAYRVSFVVAGKKRTSTPKEAEGALWIAPGTGIVKGWINRHAECDASPTRSFALKKIERR